MTNTLSLLKLCKHPIHLMSLGIGSGLSPKAPGTAGTVMAVALYYFLLKDLGAANYIAIVVALSGLGVYLCGRTAAELGVHDHPAIVWDEFIGFWLCAFMLPQGWSWLLAAFILFRIFDIIKPWPISWLDKRMKGGFGIMIDDIVAGLFAWLVLQLAAWMVY